VINLDVLYIKLLEITALSRDKKLSPVVWLVSDRVLLVCQLLQGLHISVVCRVEEKRNGKPFPLKSSP